MKKLSLAMTLLAAMLLTVPTVAAPEKKKKAKAAKIVEKDPRAEGITIGTIVYQWKDIDKAFQQLKDNQLTSCQLNYSSGMDAEYAKKVKEAQAKYGIKVTTVVGVPGRSVWNFLKGPSTIGLVPAEGRAEKIQTYHKMIDFCAAAGVKAMHSHFGFIPSDPSSSDYLYFIVVMKDLANYAKAKGVDIYFETGQETPITLVRALKDIGTGNVFINCDVANLLLYGMGNPVDAVRLFGPYLKEIHAKDGTYPSCERPNDLGDEKPIPEGDVDFPGVIKALKEIGFKGALTIECELNDSEKEYIAKTRQYLQDLLDKKD